MDGLQISFGEVQQSGKQLTEEGMLYLQEINKIYDAMHSLNGAWAGQDATEYAQIAETEKPNMERIGQIVNQFGEAFVRVSQIYSQAQDDITEMF